MLSFVYLLTCQSHGLHILVAIKRKHYYSRESDFSVYEISLCTILPAIDIQLILAGLKLYTTLFEFKNNIME